jgi:hypothetical protein
MEMTTLWDTAPSCLIEVNWRTASITKVIALMMEAVSTSELSVYFHETTRHYITEGCHLHIRHLENLTSHKSYKMYA